MVQSSVPQTVIDNLVNWLQANARDTSNLITVPSTLFPSDGSSYQYTIQLQVTNLFFQKSPISSTTVRVSPTVYVPPTRIYGLAEVFVYNSQTIQVHAISDVPSCFDATTANLTVRYTWQVYDGVVYLPHITTLSSNVKVFKLAPYTLNAGTSYTIQLVTSVMTMDGIVHSTSTRKTIRVNTPSVTVAVIGGSVQSAVATDNYSVQAVVSQGYERYEGEGTWLWRCRVLLPYHRCVCTLYSSILLYTPLYFSILPYTPLYSPILPYTSYNHHNVHVYMLYITLHTIHTIHAIYTTHYIHYTLCMLHPIQIRRFMSRTCPLLSHHLLRHNRC